MNDDDIHNLIEYLKSYYDLSDAKNKSWASFGHDGNYLVQFNLGNVNFTFKTISKMSKFQRKIRGKI